MSDNSEYKNIEIHKGEEATTTKGTYKDCQFWKTRACQGKTTNNCWNAQCPDYNRVPDYSWIPTKELIEELCKRDRVEVFIAGKHSPYFVETWGKNGRHVAGEGEARILVIKDE